MTPPPPLSGAVPFFSACNYTYINGNILQSCWKFLVIFKLCLFGGWDQAGRGLESLQSLPKGSFTGSALTHFSLILPEALAERIHTSALESGPQPPQDMPAKMPGAMSWCLMVFAGEKLV